MTQVGQIQDLISSFARVKGSKYIVGGKSTTEYLSVLQETLLNVWISFAG